MMFRLSWTRIFVNFPMPTVGLRSLQQPSFWTFSTEVRSRPFAFWRRPYDWINRIVVYPLLASKIAFFQPMSSHQVRRTVSFSTATFFRWTLSEFHSTSLSTLSVALEETCREMRVLGTSIRMARWKLLTAISQHVGTHIGTFARETFSPLISFVFTQTSPFHWSLLTIWLCKPVSKRASHLMVSGGCHTDHCKESPSRTSLLLIPIYKQFCSTQLNSRLDFRAIGTFLSELSAILSLFWMFVKLSYLQILVAIKLRSMISGSTVSIPFLTRFFFLLPFFRHPCL